MNKTLLYRVSIIGVLSLLLVVFYFTNVTEGAFLWKDKDAYVNNNHYRPPNKEAVPPAVNVRTPGSGGGSGGGAIITASEADYDNLENILPKTPMVQAIPSSGQLTIRFYNFNSGNRQWERGYLLEEGQVTQINSFSTDIDMIIHSRWLPELNENNLCDTIKSAKANGDFAAETKISKASLLWKYKGMLGFRDCLGF